MGIIIYPYLFITIVIGIIALLMIIRSFYKRQIKNSEFAIGFGISCVLYGIIIADYLLSDSAYALGAYFLFPFLMVWLPFIIAFSLRFSKRDRLRHVSRSILLSIIFSGIFIFSCQKVTFYIVDYLNIPKTY